MGAVLEGRDGRPAVAGGAPVPSAQGAGACRSRLAGRPAYHVDAQPRRINAGAHGTEQPMEFALGIASPLPTRERYAHSCNDGSGHRQEHEGARGRRGHHGSGHPTDGDDRTAAAGKSPIGRAIDRDPDDR